MASSTANRLLWAEPLARPRLPADTMNFLKENWAWIVVPILLFVAAVVALIVLGDSDPLGNHEYNL